MATTAAASTVSRSGRLASRVRWIAVRGVSAVVAGVIVLGLGGRLVMLASRLLHEEAIGRITENGNPVGVFTFDGTLELVVFGGLFSGVVAGVVWVFVKEWIPDSSVMVGVGAVAIGGFSLVDPDNHDFVILVDPWIDLVMLLTLVFGFGFVLQRLDTLLERWMPLTGGGWSTAVYALVVLLGAPFLIATFGSFFTREFCLCESPPIWTGVFLAAAALATVSWWVLDVRGTPAVPAALRRFGVVSVGGAIVAGGVHLAIQILAIP